MSDHNAQPRRTRVPGGNNSNIYRRADGKFEIGYRDSSGRQRWKKIEGGISVARAERDAILGARGRGEVVQPNPRLTFGDASDRWLVNQVSSLRPATRQAYRVSIDVHLRPRWGRRRLDHISVDDVARLVRELRAEGKSEWTIQSILKAANRVFVYARRRSAWHGENPVRALESSERPKPNSGRRRCLWTPDEITGLLSASGDRWRPLFAFAATTGARMSECLGLVWGDLDVTDREEAWATIAFQVDRTGARVDLKTEESRREVYVQPWLADLLVQHRAAPESHHVGDGDFVFATRSGRALSQRNVTRELRRAMRAATDDQGEPVFPILHERDSTGRPMPIPAGALPAFHGFRHTFASRAIFEGDLEVDVAGQLGHKNTNVTRAVYMHEIRDAEARRRRKARMVARYRTAGHGLLPKAGGVSLPAQEPAENL